MRWARVALVVTAAGSGACAKSPSSCVGTCPPTDGSVSVEDATRGAERDASDGVLRDLLAVERLQEPPAVCGDGLLRGAEECDDGNLASDDGCSADCKLEQELCPFSTAKAFCDVRLAVCGDGVLSGVEACDDGNAASGDGCAADCTTVEVGWHCRVPGRRCVPICGDQLLSGGETCDDGNSVDGDGCSSTCLLESGAAVCGDGLISGAEECDAGGAVSDDDYNGCTKACLFGARCGDGQVDPPFEDCDLGPDNGAVYGPGCTRACQVPPACGDGKIDSLFGEECDSGPTTGMLGDHCAAFCVLVIP